MRKYCFLFGPLGVAALTACGAASAPPMETFTVRVGEFTSNITVTGELEAVRSEVVLAPSIDWRFGDLKIVMLIEDGKQVKKGDLLVQFDKGEVEKAIAEAKDNLEIADAELRKARTNMASEIEGREIDLEICRINRKIAELRLQQAAFKAEIDRKQDEFRLEEAGIKLEQAGRELVNTKNIHDEEISKLKLKLQLEQAKLDAAEETLAMLEVTAPASGIAIIRKSPYTREKYQVDDKVYAGWPVIGLPDLTQMKAKVQASEIEIGKVKVEQHASVTLDAYPDTTFTGKVTEIALLARSKSKESRVKVFDVVVVVDGRDEKLMPGMTVSCQLLVEMISDAQFVPISAVSVQNGKPVVHRRIGRGFEPQPVTLGAENDTYVVVESGLAEGDEIALVDPNTIVELQDLEGHGQR
ncbi:MAG: efflux RND transporter periplasmic adaptor subunit [Candidatus Latescibacteria bacterium]|nr:efflux RND transporter periplasmic adaptor subunit [Candidatus Latescibacterota bacterium]